MISRIVALILFSAVSIFAEDADHPKIDALIKAFNTAGLKVTNITVLEHTEGSPLPNAHDEWVSFTHESVAPKGGQIFVFTRTKYADSVYAYFDALKGMAGPYLYKSKDGLIVAQLNSGMKVSVAEQFEEVIKAYSATDKAK